MSDLTQLLEEIKQMGHYSVHLYFGEDMGCDDSDTPLMERNVKIFAAPVGFLGEVRRVWTGKLAEVLAMDPRAEPKQLSNPPNPNDLDKPGIYAWGAEESIKRFMGGDRFENEKEN